MQLNVILSVLALSYPINGLYTKDCHYSCHYCGSPNYSHCIICQQPFTLSPIKNAHNIKQYYNTLEEQPWGPCIGSLTDVNPFGIVIALVSIFALVHFRNRTFFYFLSALQTLSLFSFIQIAFTGPISYVLQALEYFMFVTSVNRYNREVRLEIYDDSRYRMYEFLNSYSFKQNFIPVFILSLICFFFVVMAPISRHFSKKQSSLWSICYCKKLQKIFTYVEIVSMVGFFFLIQESILLIVIGLFLDDSFPNDSGNVVMVVIYSLVYALMLANGCSKNLDVYPNKIIEQVEMLKKTLAPMFIILPINGIIAVTAIVFILELISILCVRLSSKQQKRTQFHEELIVRQRKYRILELLVIVMIVVYYLVEKFVADYQASYACGIVAVVVIVLFFACLLFEAGYELYRKCRLKQPMSMYYRAFALSSITETKVHEQTIESFETTDEGILDMVFFGRDRSVEKQKSQQVKRKRKSNIKLTLDQLHQSNGNNQVQEQLEKFTPSVTPKNRQLEKHLKSKTSRTPKNDRSGRFKLNKVFDPEEQQRDIEAVDVPKINMKRQQNLQQDMGKQQAVNQVINAENTTERSDLTNGHPKTNRRDYAIKTGREIKIQVGSDDEHSPRFNQVQNNSKLQLIQKNQSKNHILNINNSEEDDDIEEKKNEFIDNNKDIKADREQNKVKNGIATNNKKFFSKNRGVK